MKDISLCIFSNFVIDKIKCRINHLNPTFYNYNTVSFYLILNSDDIFIFLNLSKLYFDNKMKAYFGKTLLVCKLSAAKMHGQS